MVNHVIRKKLGVCSGVSNPPFTNHLLSRKMPFKHLHPPTFQKILFSNKRLKLLKWKISFTWHLININKKPNAEHIIYKLKEVKNEKRIRFFISGKFLDFYVRVKWFGKQEDCVYVYIFQNSYSLEKNKFLFCYIKNQNSFRLVGKLMKMERQKINISPQTDDFFFPLAFFWCF